MRHLLAGLLFCVCVTGAGWCQKDSCEGYQDSPDAPHKGPRRFNVIHIAFRGDESYLSIVDPEGHKFGTASDGKPMPREITRAFYEDEQTAEMDTNLPAQHHPREMSIHYAKSGSYLIALTARSGAPQWLKITTNTCGKHWSKEITVPSATAGTVTPMALVYDSHANADPQLLKKE